MKKQIGIFAVVILVLAIGSFYGGTIYQKNKSTQSTNRNLSNNFRSAQNLTDEQRTQMIAQRGAGNGTFRSSSSTGFISGEVITKSDDSITIKLLDGGSALVYISSSTTNVTKQTTTTISNIQTGNQVMINGTKNADGSYSATMIRL